MATNEQLKVWVLIGVVTGMGTIIGFIVSVATNSLIKRLDTIVDQLRQLNSASVQHGEEIKSIKENMTLHNTRLNDHATRIRQLEINKHIET